MVSGLIGLGLSAVGSGVGMALNAKYSNMARDVLRRGHNDTQRYYDGQLAQDYTQRSDVQAVFTKTKELLADEYRKARARNIVAGGTDESLAMMQQNANNTLTDTMRGVAMNASAHKDQLSLAKMQDDAQFAQQEAQQYAQQGQNMANAASQMGNAGGQMIAGDDWSWLMGGKKKG